LQEKGYALKVFVIKGRWLGSGWVVDEVMQVAPGVYYQVQEIIERKLLIDSL
jgi:hypothetical protein